MIGSAKERKGERANVLARKKGGKGRGPQVKPLNLAIQAPSGKMGATIVSFNRPVVKRAGKEEHQPTT